MPSNRWAAFRLGLQDGWTGDQRLFIAASLTRAYTWGRRLTAALAVWR